jgi:tetratricopeptide (TPR) repeat protein
VSATDELNSALDLHRAGRLDAAAAIYRRLYDNDRSNSDACYGLGTVLMQQRQYAAAVPLLDRALSLEPDVPEFRHNYALALRGLATDLGKRRDFSAAINAFEAYMRVKGSNDADLLAYADLLLLARKTQAARQAIEQAMQAGSDVSAANLIAARCARLEGDYELARDHLRTAIDKRPAFGDAWQMRLEVEEEDVLPELAPECASLADDESLKLRDRVLLAMAAGRAFEKISDFEAAFRQFEKGNALQREDQASRDVVYDKAANEILVKRALSNFDTAYGGDADPSRQPIFIVGMPRSGTTLVERILGGLDGVALGGESESMGIIASQYYWLREQGEDVHFAELADDYWRREQCAPCRRTDKMPHNYWHVGLICAMFPASPIIYLQRDPRDVCMSIFSRVFSDGHPYSTDFESLAHNFKLSVDLMHHWQTLYPSRVLAVSYEQMIDAPEEHTQAMAAHCGLQWVPECLDFHERIEKSFTYSEMQVREPLNRKGIGAWRRYEKHLEPLIAALDKYSLLDDA